MYYKHEDEFEITPRPHSDMKSLTISRTYYEDRQFTVDSVLPMETTQEEMYRIVASEVVDVNSLLLGRILTGL